MSLGEGGTLNVREMTSKLYQQTPSAFAGSKKVVLERNYNGSRQKLQKSVFLG